MPASSFSFGYEKYERNGVDPSISFEDKVNLPPPWHYDAYPLLNAATHSTGDARYYPDRNNQRVSRHATEPFFLSLPQTEQNRLWQKQLFPKEKRLKRMDQMSAAEAEKHARTGQHPEEQERNLLDHKHRVMPFCAHTRMPVGHGVWPHLKHVHSEPGFQIYHPQQGTTRTFEWHRKHHHKALVRHGVQVLKDRLLEKGVFTGGKMDLVGALKLGAANLKHKKEHEHQQKLRRAHGFGEQMAELSFQEFRSTNGMPVSSIF